MRKSFTQLFSIFILICAFGFHSFASAPVVATTDGLLPANTDDNVKPTTTEFVVTFDQNVQFTTSGGTFTITQGTTIVRTIPLSAGSTRATINGTKLTVVHGLTLQENAMYKIGITGNAIENADKEAFAGIMSSNWGFTIGDYSGPTLKTSTPKNGEANVDITPVFNLMIEFEDAASTSNILAVDGKKVWIYNADGTIIDIIVIDGANTAVAGKKATISVDAATGPYFDEFTTYYVNIEAGAFTDDSPNKNEFAGIMDKTTWTFSTRDYSAPTVSSKSVDPVTTDGGTLQVTLNEKGHVWYVVQLASATEPTHPETSSTGWTQVATDDAGAITKAISGLDDGKSYTVYIVAENLEGDYQKTPDEIDFTTIDNTAPVSSAPMVLAQGNVTNGISLTFDEKVISGTGMLLIKKQGNNETVREVAAADVNIKMVSGKYIMTANFSGLDSEVGYYVIIPDGFVKDASMNDYESSYKTTTAWMFTSSDHVMPTVDVSIDASTPPLPGDPITLVFDETVRLVDGKPFPTGAGTNTEAEWFDYLAFELYNEALGFTAEYAGSTITLTPNADLLPNKTYVVKIRPNVIEDLSDNAFSLHEKSYELTTGDFGPATIAIVPADMAEDVVETVNPTITFSKGARLASDGSAITADNIKASVTFKETVSGAAVDFTVGWDAASMTITLMPAAPLKSELEYTVDFDHTAVEDVYKGAFGDPTASGFMVKDHIAPTAAFSHSGTVTDLAATDPLTITFSEEVTIDGADANPITDMNVDALIVFKKDGPDGMNLMFDATVSGNVISIDPDDDLVDGHVYYYGLGSSVSDAPDGANYLADSFKTFTFAPAVPDILDVAEGGYSPAIDATGVELVGGDLVAKLTFTEAIKPNPVTPASEEARLYLVGNTTPVSIEPIDAGDFSGNVLTITFTPGALTSEGDYYIQLDADVVVANADNNKTFAGILDDSWAFTAADTENPMISVSTPLDGVTNVALDAELKLTANEKVQKGTGNITITSGNGQDNQTVSVNDAMISGDGMTITIPHAGFTQYGIEYSIDVPAGAFKDMAGNNANAIVGATEWTFTTKANPVPEIVTLTPADDKDLVDAGTSTFMIEFNEEVQAGASGKTAFLFEKNADPSKVTRATLPGGGIADPGDDILKGAILIDNVADIQIAGNVVTLDFGFALEADKEYYILIEDGTFKDKSEPTTADVNGLFDAYGKWNFFTSDEFAPTWEVSYVERVSGMDITSDVVITFAKPIMQSDDTEIENAEVANLFTLAVGGASSPTSISFTGIINEAKTVVTLSNASFIPELTTANSMDTIFVAPTAGVIGKVNKAGVSTTAPAGKYVSDYDAPEIDNSTVTANTKGTEVTFQLSSNEDGTIYWWIQKGTETLTAEVVKTTGMAITDHVHTKNEEVTKTDLESETVYTLYSVAEDATGNLSGVDEETFTTPDITKPMIDGDLPMYFAENGTLTLTFTEDVDRNGAVAYIRLADTKEIVGMIDLTQPGDANKLVIDEMTDNGSPLVDFAIADWDDTQKFIIEINGGVVKDMATPTANTWDGQIGLDANAWVVGLMDDTKPAAPTVAPASPVDLDAVFTLTFNEDVQLTETASFLFEFDNGSGWQIFELVEAANVSVNGAVVSVDPDRMFWAQADDGTDWDYRFTVAANSIKDLSDNVYDQAVEFEFVTIDNTAPVVTFDPDAGASNVDINVNPTIYFSEAVTLLDGSAIDAFDLDSLIYFHKGGVAQAFSAEIDAVAKLITVDVGTLDQGTAYTLGVKAKFMDDAENVIQAKEVTFTTSEDAVTAEYVTFDPDAADDAVTVIPVEQAIRVVFAGKLYTYTNNPATNNLAVTIDYLKDVFAITPAVDFTISIDNWVDDETVIVLTPDKNLDSETSYEVMVYDDYLQIGTGNNTPLGDKDFSHETYASNDYKTVDVSQPVVDALMPVHESTVGKSTTISINFNEPVKAGMGMIKIFQFDGIMALEVDASTLVNGATNNIIEIASLSTLKTNMEYYVIIPEGAVTDLAGNKWKGITVEDEWTITVQDDVNPVITQFMPDTENTSVNTDLTIYFDRPVDLGEGFVAIYDAEGIAADIVRTNDGAGMFFTPNVDMTMYTIDIATLAEDTEYFVELAAGTFVSDADSTLENGGVDRSMWVFSTETNRVPKLLTVSPEKEAEGVELDAVAMMTFDIDVQPGMGMINLYLNDGATTVHSFDVNSDAVTFDGVTVSFDLSGHLEDQTTEYYIIVPDGAITNVSSSPQPFPGLEQTYDWRFSTVEDGSGPELLSWTPLDETIPDNHPTFVMTFDEDVRLSETGGNLVVTKVGETAAALTIALTTEMIADNVVTVEYVYDAAVGGLDKDTEYFVTVDADALEDALGNGFGGVADPEAWKFTTGPDFATNVPDPVQKTGFNIYPNPIDRDGIVVYVDNADQLSRIVISNVAGQRVKDIVKPTRDLNVGDLRSGIYFFTLIKEDGSVAKTERIVKR